MHAHVNRRGKTSIDGCIAVIFAVVAFLRDKRSRDTDEYRLVARKSRRASMVLEHLDGGPLFPFELQSSNSARGGAMWDTRCNALSFSPAGEPPFA